MSKEHWKICSRCGELKPLSEYDKSNKSSDKHRSECKPCFQWLTREEYAPNKKMKEKYGLTKCNPYTSESERTFSAQSIEFKRLITNKETEIKVSNPETAELLQSIPIEDIFANYYTRVVKNGELLPKIKEIWKENERNNQNTES